MPIRKQPVFFGHSARRLFAQSDSRGMPAMRAPFVMSAISAISALFAIRSVFGLVICSAVAASNAAEVVLGQVLPTEDQTSVGIHLRSGLQLCIDDINARGGIHGASLRLESRPRGPDDTVPRTQALLAEARPVALVGLMGTGPMEALLKAHVMQDAALPVVGVRSGASALRQGAGTEWLFHTRAGYVSEVARVFEHWRTIGLTKIGLYVEDSRFGAELRALVEAGHAQHRLKLVSVQTHSMRSPDPMPAVAAFKQSGAEAVLVAGNSDATADFYHAYRTASGAAHVVAVSTVDGAQVVRRIGAAAARGLGIVQVAPDPASPALAFSRELQALARRAGTKAPPMTQGLAEGCMAARVVAEGLRRAGPNADGARLKRALESVADMDLGGIRVGFAPGRAHASFVDIAILDSTGRLRR